MIFKRKFSDIFPISISVILVFLASQPEFGHPLRVSRKCPYGHYFNDGCVTCWCDKGTGQTVCENMTTCPRMKGAFGDLY
jgi:hypothetical protein